MSEKNKPTLTEDLTALDEAIAWFEQDDFDITQALGKYEASMELVGKIKKQLTEVENSITVLKKRFDQST